MSLCPSHHRAVADLALLRCSFGGHPASTDKAELVLRSPQAEAGWRTGWRSWLFRYRLTGKERDMGLGGASGPAAVTLAEARVKAASLLKMVKNGKDPLSERDRLAADELASAQADQIRAITFKAAAESYVEAHGSGWRNAKHRAQWTSTLETYAHPHMGDLPVSEVSTAQVMAALQPIWTQKPETASRVRGRIEAVLDYAKAREWRTGENPARWRGHVANMLPARSKVAKAQHHPALPWTKIGTFMAALRDRDATAARALEFTILTAARTGEVLGARWAEIDLKGSGLDRACREDEGRPGTSCSPLRRRGRCAQRNGQAPAR
jgi:hypothetical protein